MDRMEFTRRVLAMENRLYRVSRGLLREPQDQMDAVQEAVERAWERRDSLRKPQFFETWLTRILINACYDQLRTRKRTVPLEAVPDVPAPHEARNGELRDALDALDARLRLPVVLHYMEGYRIREIAAMLELPTGTVKTRLARAKRELKRLLDGEEGRA